jgi:hypothetical protein
MQYAAHNHNHALNIVIPANEQSVDFVSALVRVKEDAAKESVKICTYPAVLLG